MQLLRIILSPLLIPCSILYRWITDGRNFLFDKKKLKSIEFEVLTINVGNLTAGGTGKTPFVTYLIDYLLKQNKKVGTVSRGYGRNTKGIYAANEQMEVHDIGDEPMMYWQAYKEKIGVVVGEERMLAIPFLLQEFPSTEVVIMDDAYQHRYVKPHFNVLITDYKRLFTKDYVLPFGLLRESRKGAKRADAVIVSKCPHNMSNKEIERITDQIKRYSKPSTEVAFTCIKEKLPVGISPEGRKVIIVSGIAQNKQFEHQVRTKYDVIDVLHFKDHHWYSKFDLQQLKLLLQKYAEFNPVVVTTEKDFVRLQSHDLKDVIEGLPLCYIPIQVEFIIGEKVFLSKLNNKLKQNGEA